MLKGKNYSRVEKQGEKPTFSNYSFVEIKGSIPDLFPDHDFIELREKDEPHYIDKIKIIIHYLIVRKHQMRFLELVLKETLSVIVMKFTLMKRSCV